MEYLQNKEKICMLYYFKIKFLFLDLVQILNMKKMINKFMYWIYKLINEFKFYQFLFIIIYLKYYNKLIDFIQ